MREFIFLISLLLCSNSLTAQRKVISFIYNEEQYEEVAQRRFEKLHLIEKSDNIPVFSTKLIGYGKEQLDFISIPIFGWNEKPYRCGDNLELLLQMEQDLLFQEVLIVAKESNIRVGKFEIFDSYNEENRSQDSINNVKFSLHSRPVQSDTKKVEKNLHKFIKENPEVFVFMIKGLHGYWGIIEGELVKLISGVCGIKGEEGSSYICKKYGRELINDIIKDCFRTGYKYIGCPDCEINEKVGIEIN